jgi:hypothetical protein
MHFSFNFHLLKRFLVSFLIYHLLHKLNLNYHIYNNNLVLKILFLINLYIYYDILPLLLNVLLIHNLNYLFKEIIKIHLNQILYLLLFYFHQILLNLIHLDHSIIIHTFHHYLEFLIIYLMLLSFIYII